MFKRIIGGIILCLLFAGSICGLVFGIKYNNVKDHEWNMTIEQEYINEIEKLKTSIKDNNKKIEELNSQINSLQISLDEALSNLEDKEDIIESDILLIENYKKEIENLNSEVVELQDLVKYYEELIASYDFVDKSVITFKVNDEVYDVAVVENNVNFNKDIEEPFLLGYSFAGWSSDGISAIVLEETTFSRDTTLTALFEEEEQTYSVLNLFSYPVWASYKYSGAESKSFYSNLTIEGNSVKDITFSPFIYSFTDRLEGINVKDFAILTDNILSIRIPTSYIEENYPDRIPTNYIEQYYPDLGPSENFLSCKYIFENGNFKLYEISEWCDQSFYDYPIKIHNDILNVYNFEFSNTLGEKEYSLVLNFKDYIPVSSVTGVLKEENGEIIFVSDYSDIVVEKINGIYILKFSYVQSNGLTSSYSYLFYINENNIPIFFYEVNPFQILESYEGFGELNNFYKDIRNATTLYGREFGKFFEEGDYV